MRNQFGALALQIILGLVFGALPSPFAVLAQTCCWASFEALHTVSRATVAAGFTLWGSFGTALGSPKPFSGCFGSVLDPKPFWVSLFLAVRRRAAFGQGRDVETAPNRFNEKNGRQTCVPHIESIQFLLIFALRV